MSLRTKSSLRTKQSQWALRGVLAASLVSSGLLMTVGGTAAHADSPLLAYTAVGDANTIDIVIDTAAGLAGFHPLSQADLPEASSDYETGPSGRAFTSVAWPGAAAGNVGSLGGAFGLPAQLAPLSDQLNDPIRAEANYPAGKHDVVFPAGNTSGAVQMHAQATADKTTASAAFSDLTSALFNVQGLEGSSTGTAAAAAKATASGSFSGFSLLGGLLTVGSTSSTASATSDGVTPKAESTTHVGALTVLGRQVSIGSDGLIVGPATATGLDALLTPSEATVNSIINLLNLKVATLPQTVSTDVPAASVTSGALQISFALPSSVNLSVDCSALKSLPAALQQVTILCTLPGLLAGANVTITLARVTAQAVASPPFDTSGLTGPPPGSPASSSPASTTPATTGTGPQPPVDTSGGGTITGGDVSTPGLDVPSTTPPPAIAEPLPGSLLGTQKVALSKPVGSGILIGLLLLAGLAGGLLLWTSALLDAAPATSCPLEEQR